MKANASDDYRGLGWAHGALTVQRLGAMLAPVGQHLGEARPVLRALVLAVEFALAVAPAAVGDDGSDACIDTPGMREITGSAAALIPKLEVGALVDVLLRLADDRPWRDGVAASGLANSQRFSWERCSQETLAVLREAASIST